MDHQQGLIVGVGGRGAPIERTSDHRFVVDHGELVMQLVAAGEARGLLVLPSEGHLGCPLEVTASNEMH